MLMDEFTVFDIGSILPVRRIRRRRNKPAYCAFPVVGMPWDIIPFSTCETALQKWILVGASIWLFEANASSRTRISMAVRKPSAFLFFLLRGQACFYGTEEQLLSTAEAPVYHLVYSPAGKFVARLEKGQHSLLVISLDNNWFVPTKEKAYPAFTLLLQMWRAKANTPLSLPQKEIPLKIWKTLIRIRTAVVENMDDGLKVLSLISECVSCYHDQLLDPKEVSRQADLIKAKILKAHLSKIYMFEEECRIDRLEEELGWTSWTLRKTAKKALGCTIGRYIQKLRVQKAEELLLTGDMQVREIAIRVGFSSAASFIRAFKKNTGVSPNGYRNRKRDG